MFGFEKNLIEKDNGDGTITILGNCVFTKNPHTVTVDKVGYNSYRAGKQIQYALPNASDDDREFIMSGISPDGLEKSFKKED